MTNPIGRTWRCALVLGAGLGLLPAQRAGAAPTAVSVEVEEPAYDGYRELIDGEARTALGQGDYKRARRLFHRLLQLDPDDARALREAGRVEHALGEFASAAELLAKAHELRPGIEDPELHYLRGEALLALGRKGEAARELATASSEIGPAPTDRREILWLARIEALGGDLAAAEALYAQLTSDERESAEHAEVTLYRVEAHTLTNDFAGAERLLREFLQAQPDHTRAREMLAWVLEARGKSDEELTLRAVLSEEWSEHPRKVVEYARALERGHDYPGALQRYRRARELGVREVSDDIERLENRLSPEVGAGMIMTRDPSGSVVGWTAGATLPLSSRLRISAVGTHDIAEGMVTEDERKSTTGAGWGVLTGKGGGVAAVGATVRQREGEHLLGGSGVVYTGPHPRFQAQLRTDLNAPWRENASTVRMGGVVDSLSTSLYVSPWPGRMLVTLGAQARRLGLEPEPFMPEEHAIQLFGVAGVDFTLSSRPGNGLRSQILDGEMLAPLPFAPATIVGYRHYEMSSDDPFGARLSLVERSGIDEVSGLTRQVYDGTLGAELRGGVGYDRLREVRAWRAGGSFLLSVTSTSRLTFDYDIASEQGTGIAGRRHQGLVVLHVDP